MKGFILGTLVIAGLFAFDYCIDYPHVLHIPEVFTCATLEELQTGAENAWFQVCWP